MAQDCRSGMKWAPKQVKEQNLSGKPIKVWRRQQIEPKIELAFSAPSTCSGF